MEFEPMHLNEFMKQLRAIEKRGGSWGKVKLAHHYVLSFFAYFVLGLCLIAILYWMFRWCCNRCRRRREENQGEVVNMGEVVRQPLNPNNPFQEPRLELRGAAQAETMADAIRRLARGRRNEAV